MTKKWLKEELYQELGRENPNRVTIESLINRGLDPNTRYKYKITGENYNGRYTSWSRDFLKKGHSLSCSDPLLCIAVEKAWTDVVRLLLEQGAKVKEVSKIDNGHKERITLPPLYLAVISNRVGIAQLLINEGVNINKYAKARKEDYSYTRTPLYLAACWGNRSAMVELLLKHGAEMDTGNKGNETPLNRACANKNYDTARLLLEKKATVGRKELYYATCNEWPDIIEILLNQEIDPFIRKVNHVSYNKPDEKRDNRLMTGGSEKTKALFERAQREWIDKQENLLLRGKLCLAAEAGLTDTMETLLKTAEEEGYTFSDGGKSKKRLDGGTLLFFAANNAHLDTVNLLLEKGARAAEVSLHNTFQCLYQLLENDHHDIARALLEAGIYPFPHRVIDGNSILYFPDYSSWSYPQNIPVYAQLVEERRELGNLLREVQEKWFKSNSSFSAQDKLQLAVRGNFIKIATEFLETEDVDVNKKIGGFYGSTTLLHLASYHGHEQVVSLLLDRGAKVNRKVKYQGIPLCCAVSGGHPEIIQLLLTKGSKVDVEMVYGPNGKTIDALYTAVIKGKEWNKEIIELLLNVGADINKSYDGKSLLHKSVMQYFGHMRTVTKDSSYQFPHAQCDDFNDLYSIVEFFLAQGANPLKKDSSGNTALTYLSRVAEAIKSKDTTSDELSETANQDALHKTVRLVKAYEQAWKGNGGKKLESAFFWEPEPSLPPSPASKKPADAVQPPSPSPPAPSEELPAPPPVSESDNAPLFTAIKAGDIDAVREELNKEIDVNTQNDKKETPLHAASDGNLEIFSLLLERGADPFAPHHSHRILSAAKYGLTKKNKERLQAAEKEWLDTKEIPINKKLRLAACIGYLEAVEAALQKGADIETKDKYQFTPLYDAVLQGHKEVVAYLLQKGADPKTKNCYTNTPLHSTKDKDIARLLLDAGADIDARDKNQYTPLHIAALEGKKEVVEYLLQKGADPKARNCYEDTPLHLTMSSLFNADITKLLLGAGAEVNARDKNQCTPLHRLRFLNWQFQTKGILLLIEKNADVHAQDEDGNMPLHILADTDVQRNSVAIDALLTLLQYGANPLQKNGAGKKPSELLKKDRVESRALLEGYEKKWFGNDGQCPDEITFNILGLRGLSIRKTADQQLLEAASKGNLKEIQKALGDGAKIEAQDDALNTALYIAVKQEKKDVIEYLLIQGANTNTRDYNGRTPLHMAAYFKNDKSIILDLLLKSGADVKARDFKKETPLHKWAQHDGSKENAQRLLEKEADINATNKHGETPLSTAVSSYCSTKYSTERLTFLLEHGADPRLGNPKPSQLSWRNPYYWMQTYEKNKQLLQTYEARWETAGGMPSDIAKNVAKLFSKEPEETIDQKVLEAAERGEDEDSAQLKEKVSENKRLRKEKAAEQNGLSSPQQELELEAVPLQEEVARRSKENIAALLLQWKEKLTVEKEIVAWLKECAEGEDKKEGKEEVDEKAQEQYEFANQKLQEKQKKLNELEAQYKQLQDVDLYPHIIKKIQKIEVKLQTQIRSEYTENGDEGKYVQSEEEGLSETQNHLEDDHSSEDENIQPGERHLIVEDYQETISKGLDTLPELREGLANALADKEDEEGVLQARIEKRKVRTKKSKQGGDDKILQAMQEQIEEMRKERQELKTLVQNLQSIQEEQIKKILEDVTRVKEDTIRQCEQEIADKLRITEIEREIEEKKAQLQENSKLDALCEDIKRLENDIAPLRKKYESDQTTARLEKWLRSDPILASFFNTLNKDLRCYFAEAMALRKKGNWQGGVIGAAGVAGKLGTGFLKILEATAPLAPYVGSSIAGLCSVAALINSQYLSEKAEGRQRALVASDLSTDSLAQALAVLLSFRYSLLLLDKKEINLNERGAGKLADAVASLVMSGLKNVGDTGNDPKKLIEHLVMKVSLSTKKLGEKKLLEMGFVKTKVDTARTLKLERTGGRKNITQTILRRSGLLYAKDDGNLGILVPKDQKKGHGFRIATQQELHWARRSGQFYEGDSKKVFAPEQQMMAKEIFEMKFGKLLKKYQPYKDVKKQKERQKEQKKQAGRQEGVQRGVNQEANPPQPNPVMPDTSIGEKKEPLKTVDELEEATNSKLQAENKQYEEVIKKLKTALQIEKRRIDQLERRQEQDHIDMQRQIQQLTDQMASLFSLAPLLNRTPSRPEPLFPGGPPTRSKENKKANKQEGKIG